MFKQVFYLHIIKVFIFIDDLIPKEGSQYILFNHTISIPLAKSQQRQTNEVYPYRTVCIFVVNEKTPSMRQ